MSYADLLAEHQRIAILHVLAEAPGFTANDSMICTQINVFGLTSSRDQVRTQIAWLKEQGIVKVDEVAREGRPPILVATLTERGADIEAGRVTVPGVHRAGPK